MLCLVASIPRVFEFPALSLQSWPTLEKNSSPVCIGFSDLDGSSPDTTSPQCKKIFLFMPNKALNRRIRIRLYPQTFCRGFKNLLVHTLCGFVAFSSVHMYPQKRCEYTLDLLTSYRA